MPFHLYKELKYFTFSSIGEGVRYGIFTRRGGISPSPWRSLNMGGTVGDDDDNVKNNRQAGFEALNLNPASIFDAWQVHGTNIICTDLPRNLEQPPQKADILLTNKPGVTLMMRFADCTPIILYDPIKKVVGIVHAGWMGTVNKAVKLAISAMESRYGCNPAKVLAGIGPSIGPDHYEVGDNVISCVRSTFGEDQQVLIKKENGKIQFDLWSANRILLEQSGVKEIEIAGICTGCHLEDWFSHRGENGFTGRFGALIALEDTNE